MIADAKGQAFGSGRLFPTPYDVPLWTDPRCVPRVMRAVVQVEIVMMARHSHEIFRANLLVAPQQCRRIPCLGLPFADDVHEAGIGRMPIIGDMMLVGRTSGHIHQAAIPIARFGLALRPPMRPDSEFGIAEPFRGVPTRDKRRPVRLKRCGMRRCSAAHRNSASDQIAPTNLPHFRPAPFNFRLRADGYCWYRYHIN